jgi:uncharacterized protein YdeI (YjbR/CyaY-like superfamily)
MAPVIVDLRRVKSFVSEAAFEAWLAKHHATTPELWLKLHKKGSGLPSVTSQQAIDVALCWGWIDGIRKAFDDTSFLQRFTPRQARSIWSRINREHVARLSAAGRMTVHGQRQVDAARADGRWAAAYAASRELTIASIPADLRAAIDANPRACAALASIGRQDLFALVFRVNAMKTPAGRTRKIATLVQQLARDGRIVTPRSKPKPKPARR